MGKRMAKPKKQPDLMAAGETVRMHVTSDKHAFDDHGVKHWQGSRPVVPIAVAEDWMKHNRAEPL
jgi:hypothetical protein